MTTFEWFFPGQSYARAEAIVREVFLDELGANPAHLFDESTPLAHHLVLQLDGVDAATGRVSRIDESTCLIGCIAVRKALRAQHLGGALVTELLAQAKRLGCSRVRVLSRESAVGFYQRLGFALTNAHFSEDGTEKYWMERGIADET